MEWNDAIREAKIELGYNEDEYIEDWNEVVSIAKEVVEEKKDNYYEYLESNEWKERRREVLERDGYSCNCCKTYATQVHHESYNNVMEPEEVDDCISVCEECHKLIHEELEEKKKFKKLYPNVRL